MSYEKGTIFLGVQFCFPTEELLFEFQKFKGAAEKISDNYKLCFVTSDTAEPYVKIYAREKNEIEEIELLEKLRKLFKQKFPNHKSF